MIVTFIQVPQNTWRAQCKLFSKQTAPHHSSTQLIYYSTNIKKGSPLIQSVNQFYSDV